MTDMHSAFIRYVGHPLVKAMTGNRQIYAYLREFERTQFLSMESIRTRQFQLLQSMIQHAYEQCPYYRSRLDAEGLVPSDFRDFDDFTKFPLLEKSDIQAQRDEMIAANWPRQDLIKNQTGGSTGTPIAFCLSRDRTWSRAAATIRHDRMAGWEIGDKYVSIWGAAPSGAAAPWRARFRNHLIKRHRQLDTSNLTEARMRDFAIILQKFQPRTIIAYAKSLSLFAAYLQDKKITPWKPHSIITSAEVLEPEDRVRIEEVFGCRVFNRYGCREFSVVASECPCHHGLHVMAEGLLVEIVRNGRPVSPGEIGSIVITDLLNCAMPMIRYQIGDMGRLTYDACPCGRGLPRLYDIAGRVTDFLVGPDGRLVSGVYLATYVVAQRPTLGQVQIHQHTAGQIQFRIKPSPGFQLHEDTGYLQQATQRILGDATQVEWILVDELERHPSGKYRFSWSTVTPSYLKGEPSVP
jgi:phenylacetate-CoA ligase